jgi:predicted nucleotidyltransferase
MMSLNELPYNFIDQLKSLPFIHEIFLYGSRARGDHLSRSDIDLAIVCPKANEREWQQVIDIVEEADTLLKIDFVRLDTLPDGKLKRNIERDKKPVYSRKEDPHDIT